MAPERATGRQKRSGKSGWVLLGVAFAWLEPWWTPGPRTRKLLFLPTSISPKPPARRGEPRKPTHPAFYLGMAKCTNVFPATVRRRTLPARQRAGLSGAGGGWVGRPSGSSGCSAPAGPGAGNCMAPGEILPAGPSGEGWKRTGVALARMPTAHRGCRGPPIPGPAWELCSTIRFQRGWPKQDGGYGCSRGAPLR